MDASFGTNKHGFHFAFTSGIGCEFETVPFLAGLLGSATDADFVWYLEQLIEIMEFCPEVFFVDGALEEHNAIQKVCPEAIIIMCIFHLFMQNMHSHLHGVLGTSWGKFYACMWRSFYAETQELHKYHYNSAIKCILDTLPLEVGVTVTLHTYGKVEVRSWGPQIEFVSGTGEINRVLLTDFQSEIVFDIKSKNRLVKALSYMKQQLFDQRHKWASCFIDGFTCGQSASVRAEQQFAVLKSKATGGWPKNATLRQCVNKLLSRIASSQTQTFWRLRRQKERLLRGKV